MLNSFCPIFIYFFFFTARAKLPITRLINTQTHLNNSGVTLTQLKSAEQKEEIHVSSGEKSVFLDQFKTKEVAVISSCDIFVL